jgi:hypothetical protein
MEPAKRSLAGAYRILRDGKRGSLPGYISKWSSEHAWVERAKAYDEWLDGQRREARVEVERDLVKRRAEYEHKNQDRLEETVEKLRKMLAEAAEAPVVGFTRVEPTTNENGKIVEITVEQKGINLGQVARLVHVTNLTALQAILGPPRPVEDAPADEATRGVDVRWIAPPNPDEPEPAA